MLLDHFTGHFVNVELSNIELFYIPKNATSILQPVDQGIIANVKAHYTRLLMEKLVKKLDEGKKAKVNELEAVQMLNKSWKSVKEETIQNCWKHAGFTDLREEDEERDDEPEDMDATLNHLLGELRVRDSEFDMEVDEFLGIDES